jgi:hypothetical protein
MAPLFVIMPYCISKLIFVKPLFQYPRTTSHEPRTTIFALTAWGRIFYNRVKREIAMKTTKKIIFAAVLVLGLAGCGQVYDREPVGIGYDNDELKLSPCACLKVYSG